MQQSFNTVLKERYILIDSWKVVAFKGMCLQIRDLAPECTQPPLKVCLMDPGQDSMESAVMGSSSSQIIKSATTVPKSLFHDVAEQAFL